MVNGELANSEEPIPSFRTTRHSAFKDAPKRAFGALIRNLAGLKKIPGSPLRGAPE
jgi:hypothetical protein